ncbi:MAG: site-specific DNA-methyltransferase, partial [Bacteroidota bacterium]
MATIDKQPLTSMNITEEQLLNFKQLFPEVFTEGLKVDWEKLKLTLGETVDTGKERYGMNWPGKADCFKTIQQPSIATLVPARDESIDFDTTENLFIEGDNLEVLKLLQKSYLGKVKMIYIDPPYNTGNDFVYPDNYSENLNTYLEYTGQVDSEGRKFGTNTDTDGRFHSKWINMMYPRLFLAKNLLKRDGVIFISIDDSELDNLKKILSEIFGEENFVSQLIWKKRVSPANDAKWFSSDHEYLLVFAKDKESWYPNRTERNEEQNSYYTNPDNDPKGNWNSAAYTCNKSKEERPNLFYPLINPFTGEEVWPKETAVWAYSKETHLEHVNNNILYWGADGKSKSPRKKQYLFEAKPVVPRSFIDHKDGGSTQSATLDFLKLFDYNYFQYTKPLPLLSKLIDLSSKPNDNDIVIDFFAGSSSFGHAVMLKNSEQKGNRKFILVQLPESIDEKSEASKAGYNNIAEISKERLRRAATKIKTEIETNNNKRIGEIAFEELTTNKSQLSTDLGFKVFKLDHSNFKIWDATLEKEPEAIQARLFEHIHHISPEAAQESILYELLLKSGFELTTPIEKLILAEKTVFSIAGGQLLICLEKELSHDCIKAMAEMQPTRVICLDEAFTGVNADA